MNEAVSKGELSLDSQVRAYDLLDSILEHGLTVTGEAVSEYCARYESEKTVIDGLYDDVRLKAEAAERLTSLKAALQEIRFEAAAAASLHEFAKEVFDVWQTSGIFARRRALRELRERAGFRLESHRIGNYVAKTFDLMNEAQSRFAKAQQAVFTADVTYKVRPDVYGDIYKALCKTNS